MLRVGVLGAGGHSSRDHGPALNRYRARNPDTIQLTAVCDLDRTARTEYAERFGFKRTYEHGREMLAAESLDALIVVTPVDATRAVVGELLSESVPILIEKPPGRTVEAARELAAIADQYGTPHAVSLNRRFDPAIDRFRDWFDKDPATDTLQYVVGRLHRIDRTEPGFVKNTGIHAVDTVAAILGRPSGVRVDRWRTSDGTTPGGHYALGQMQCETARGSVEMVSDGGRRTERYVCVGPGMTATVDVEASTATGWVNDEEVMSWSLAPDTPREVRNGTYDETVAFLDAVCGRRPFEPTLQEVLPSLAVAQAMDRGQSSNQ